MAKRSNTKSALFFSIVSMFLCFAMLLGTTLAWFTDSVTSTGNKIQAGTLKVDLQLLNKNGSWNSIKAEKDPIWDAEANKLWEPGYTDVKIFKIVNDGSLALKWKAAFTAEEQLSALANVIDVYVKPWGVLTEAEAQQNVAYPADRSLTGYTKVGTLAQFVETIEATTYGVLNANESAYLGIALHMQESADNLYQGKTIGEFDITIIATQKTEETDSFDNTYDENAAYPLVAGRFHTASAPVDQTKVDPQTNKTTEDIPLGDGTTVPAGVQLNEGVSELTLNQSYVAPGQSEAVIEATAGELITRMDIHMEGVSSNNTTPIPVPVAREFPKNLTANNIGFVHVENGVTVPMVAVNSLEELDAHNEFYYDPATGKVTLSMATFSEVVATVDPKNPWDGTSVDTTWYNTTDTTFTLTDTADFAGFAQLVDDGNTFAGKTVKLGADINLGGHNFDPIGWGYDYTDYNVGDVAGKTFKGTFDGGEYDENGELIYNYTIYNLYQNGWDLESTTGTDYTYTNCGGGLFAAACDATIKNLTIDGAQVTFECVEIGVVVGLAQGNCTFENITVRNAKIANYQRPAGGVVGEVSPAYDGAEWYGTHTFKNITVDPTVVVGSLWGDFDAPVGGVIGARWDDADVSKVVMNNVSVAARLDVYNDVTSTYQWYAYRRAGMLIGNTDTPPANGKDSAVATANFLTCENVTVHYGSWVNYHYCEFSNHNSNWPWVRVEAGENCSAFSNPRYGVPNDINGVKVTPENHGAKDTTIHKEGDECYVELTFNQLYGGGQGVYGQPKHDGVTTSNYAYTITYIDGETVIETEYVPSNETSYTIEKKLDATTFAGWVTLGAVKTTEIDAGNTKDVVLYATYDDIHTARWVDADGNVIATQEFSANTTPNTWNSIAGPAASTPAVEFKYWEVRNEDGTFTAITNFTNPNETGRDITFYPYYEVSNTAGEGTILLVGEDIDGDGRYDRYRVDAARELSGDVVIPGEINGVPVTVITDLSSDFVNGLFSEGVKSVEIQDGVETIAPNAFSGTAGLKEVIVPITVTSIGTNAFSSDWGAVSSKQVSITYAGTWAQWQAICNTETSDDTNWDSGLGNGSKVVCTDGTYVLNTTWLDSDHTWGDWKKQ